MPVFKFGIEPTDVEVQQVMEAFEIDVNMPLGPLPTYSGESLRSLFARLDKVRDILLKCYRTRDWKSCSPSVWTSKCAFKVLRHFLRTRSMTTTSKTTRRRGGGFCRNYTVVAYPKSLHSKNLIVSIVPVKTDMLV